MSSRFAITITLACLALTQSRVAAAETMTLEEYMHGTADPGFAMEAADDNPFEDVGREPTIVAPATPAVPDRTPCIFVVFSGIGPGNFGQRVDLKPDATVGSVVRTVVCPHPIELKTTKVAVHRPRYRIHSDLTVEREEEILHVEWDAKTGQPTEITNHRLMPLDRLTVTLPPKATPLVQQLRTYTPAPVVSTPVGAAPPMLAATPQIVASEAPQPVLRQFDPARPMYGMDVQVVATDPPMSEAEMKALSPSMVRFDVVVVEDVRDSFSEFDQLRSRMPFMLSDSATMQGTLRILEKHDLVRRIAEPQLMVAVGEQATIEVGSELPDKDLPWQGMKAEVAARKLGGGLAVDFSFKKTSGHRTNEVQTSLIVPHGQTVVMKTGGHLAELANADTTAKDETDKVEHAVYVVLTPEIVK